MTRTLNYRNAIAQALADELASDEQVILLGEDIGAAGGVFKTTKGLYETFGPRRVRDTPISEQAIIGAAIGAAAMGLRPVAEIMFADFAAVCFDQIANQTAKYRYLTGGQVSLPLTIRLCNGSGLGFGAQHSQAVENWFLNVPGLKIAVPGTAEDAYGLLRAAIRENNPVLVFEHKALFDRKGEVPTSPTDARFGKAAVVRSGSDVTIVAAQLMVHRAVQAAEVLSSEGIEAEIIDPRTLAPFDDDTVAASLATTSRLLCVAEGPPSGSWGASLIARICEHHFDLLDGPPRLLACDDIPIPYSAPLERASMPDAESICRAIREMVTY
jgi:pyruvate dehydrogenase E1 component beta subunit